jgi:hypothetical protein
MVHNIIHNVISKSNATIQHSIDQLCLYTAVIFTVKYHQMLYLVLKLSSLPLLYKHHAALEILHSTSSFYLDHLSEGTKTNMITRKLLVFNLYENTKQFE